MNPTVVVIDNYDSFTYNLVQYLGELGATTEVIRNDGCTVAELAERDPAAIVISPGPGTPDHAGISLDVIEQLGPRIPVFGVCLGLQAIGQAFGARVVRAPLVVHGKVSDIHHDRGGVFADAPSPLRATRYHSLVVERDSLPEVLEVTAWTADGVVMGLRHATHPVEGVQFHPESIGTSEGRRLLGTFLSGAGVTRRDD